MVVALSGYYGFRNAGDEAILQAIVGEIKARGHEVLVFSKCPSETEQDFSVHAASRNNPFALWGGLRRAQLLLSGGGGLLQDRTSSRSLSYYLGVIRLAQAQRRQVVVFNQSLGPLTRSGARRVRKVLEGVPVVVRDRASLGLAGELGLQASLGADPALLLTPPPVGRDRSLVVMVPRVGLSAANQALLHSAHALRERGFQVLAVGMQPGFDDESLALFQGFPRELTSDPRRLLYLFAQARIVISLRLHGLILAAAAGTPFAGFPHDSKLGAFLDESGGRKLAWPVHPDQIVLEAQSAQEPDWAAIAALKQRARQSFASLFSEPLRARLPNKPL